MVTLYQLHVCLCLGSFFPSGASTIRRYPGFVQGYAGGKRVELKLTPSHACRQFMLRHFDEFCKNILKYTNSRNPLIQQALLMLLPKIAAFNQDFFALK